MSNFLKRSDKVAFYEITSGNPSVTTYERMTGFSDISISKNPKEYTRQYVDMDFEQSDIVGFSPTISFSFDQEKGNNVHDDIVEISNRELTGENAIRNIILVDLSDGDATNGYSAIKRSFSVIVSQEGSSFDSYKFSGDFKVKGDKIFGKASSSDNFETITFTAD